MTSSAQLPALVARMQTVVRPCREGNCVKLLCLRKSATSPALEFTALDETCAESRGEIVKLPGPLARQGGHLCPPGSEGENASQQLKLRRTVLPTSCGCQVHNTTSCILRLFRLNQKSNSRSFPTSQIPGMYRAPEYDPSVLMNCVATRFSPIAFPRRGKGYATHLRFDLARNSKPESRLTLWTLAPQCTRFNARSRCSYVDGCGL